VAIRLCAVGALAAIRPDGHRDAPVFGIGSRQLELPMKAAAAAVGAEGVISHVAASLWPRSWPRQAHR